MKDQEKNVYEERVLRPMSGYLGLLMVLITIAG